MPPTTRLLPILASGLMGIALSSCGKYDQERPATSNYTTETGSFDSFGPYYQATDNPNHDQLAIATGDFDGDGDIDVFLGYRDNREGLYFVLYENKIPQKK